VGVHEPGKENAADALDRRVARRANEHLVRAPYLEHDAPIVEHDRPVHYGRAIPGDDPVGVEDGEAHPHYTNGVKPGDHPEFFRFPAPEGRSRESTIRLDAEGHFFHDGAPVEHPKLAQAMHTWISRHPDDGRYILTNGYDWTYFIVDDAPFFVRAVRLEKEGLVLLLSDGSEEAWDPARTEIGAANALYTEVKRAAKGGPFRAKFTRHAQASLEPVLAEDGGFFAAKVGDRVVRLGAQK
jgi:hypothetical protein